MESGPGAGDDARAALGPVSQALTLALREEARQHGIVVWLDREGVYRNFADALAARAVAGAFPYPVRCLRGSYLELIRSLDGVADGVTTAPLIVHVPGHTEDTISHTPLYEVYCAGRRFRRALPTLIREAAHGVATPEAIDAFLGGTPSLEDADAWLAALAAPRADGPGPEASLGLLSAADIHDKLRSGTLGPLLAEQPAAIWTKLEALVGMDQAWRTAWLREPTASALADELVAWALCVEFVHDLARGTSEEALLPLRTLPRINVEACRELAAHLRDRHPGDYARIADDAEVRLRSEVERATADDLGRVDTFRFEDKRVMAAALGALMTARFDAAFEYARARSDARSFWTRHDHGRRTAWSLILAAATLGRAVAAQHRDAGRPALSLADATRRYAERGWQVDRAHRELEQARPQLQHLELDELADLRAALDQLRHVYRRWADDLSSAWADITAATGALPPSELQQRTLFTDVVAPLCAEELTAYFMVDALRYEMGRALAEGVGEIRGTEVVMDARLAELPSVTEVGMNALAPVAQPDGRIAMDVTIDGITGLRAGTVRIADPEQRRRLVYDKVGGQACPRLSLEEVLARDVTSLRQAVARARLVIVHAEGIDRAGERGLGLARFDAELQNLRAAWRLLFEAGVRRFVITADHGFLLHDPTTGVQQPHGKLTDPSARYTISAHPITERGELTVGAVELGYASEPVWFQFPRTTAQFDRGRRTKDFAHGGPSAQERVIPVITIRHRNPAGGESARYRLELKPSRIDGGVYAVPAVVHSAGQASLSYGGRAELELVLECVDDPDVIVEVIEARGARLDGAVVHATADTPFELRTRVRGPNERRVQLRLRHATRWANVTAADSDERFQVDVRAIATLTTPAPPPPTLGEGWLDEFPAGPVRDVLRHLAVHGKIDEEDATRILGGARQYRAFGREFERTYRARLPFAVRVETAGGRKSHVRGDR